MALESFRRDFGLDKVSKSERDTLEGNIVSTFQVGCFFGSLLTFPLAERFGRKLAIVMAVSVFCVGGSLMVRRLSLSPRELDLCLSKYRYI
jgi:MFS family permease